VNTALYLGFKYPVTLSLVLTKHSNAWDYGNDFCDISRSISFIIWSLRIRYRDYILTPTFMVYTV
jgi:hypothetical protein